MEVLSTEFNKWLDAILADVNEMPIAWNFNLYEPFGIELVGTKSFSRKDKDWAGDEIFTSRDKFPDFELSSKQWEEAAREAESFINGYLENGNYRSKLLESHAVACGFVDGDLTLLYLNPNKRFRRKKEKISIEIINELPLWKIKAWMIVYTDSPDNERFDDFLYNEMIPNEQELNEMRKFLFDAMVKSNVKL